MRLKASDKLQGVLFLGQLEHNEQKILYQFVVGGIVSGSVAILVGIIQGYLTILVGLACLTGLWDIGVIMYFFIKRRLISIRKKISEDVKRLEGLK